MEIRLSSDKVKLIENDAGAFDEIKEVINQKCFDEEDFTDIEIKVITLSKEEFLLRTAGKDISAFTLRKKIKAFYDNANKKVSLGIVEVER